MSISTHHNYGSFAHHIIEYASQVHILCRETNISYYFQEPQPKVLLGVRGLNFGNAASTSGYIKNHSLLDILGRNTFVQAYISFITHFFTTFFARIFGGSMDYLVILEVRFVAGFEITNFTLELWSSGPATLQMLVKYIKVSCTK